MGEVGRTAVVIPGHRIADSFLNLSSYGNSPSLNICLPFSNPMTQG